MAASMATAYERDGDVLWCAVRDRWADATWSIRYCALSGEPYPPQSSEAWVTVATGIKSRGRARVVMAALAAEKRNPLRFQV